MRLFLTGGSGYLGGRLAARLLARGDRVDALVRPASARAELERGGARCFEGDVTDRYSMREAMSGADWVVHAAALLDFSAPETEMERVNVAGAENVASLAWKLGVPRLLFLSSIAAFGGSAPDGSPSTETSPPALPMPSVYSATKRAGEAAVAAWGERGLAVNVVYPSLVYGPPGKGSGANALLRQIARGRLRLLVGADRWTSWVFIDDLVDGLLGVIDRAPAGESYLLAGEAATVGDLVGRVCSIAEVRPPLVGLPAALAAPLGALARALYRLRGRRPPFRYEQLESLRRHWRFDDAKARTGLDWRPRGLEAGLPPTVRHLLELE